MDRQHTFINWENEARRILKAEIVRRGLTYSLLAKRLQAMGVYETERSVANKMSRGTFSFVFFLQCMKAMGASSISFELMVDIPTLGRRR